MPFDATAEPSAFPEAEAYFRHLVPMTAADYERLSAEEKARAFTVAAATQLDAVQSLHDDIARAIQAGEGFEAFKRRVKARMKGDWAKADSHRLETIFRTNVSTAYNTGRWYQQQDPELTAVRPWMVFDTVDDDRRSPICTELADTVKRHDDPFVARYWPPLHHRERSQWQSISSRRARELGVTAPEDEPTPKVSDGFGMAPPFRSEWRPDGARYTPQLWQAHEAKVAEMRSRL